MREQERRQDRRIRERLGHAADDAAQRVEQRLIIDPHWNVPRANALRERRSVAALVIRLLRELRRERVHPVDADELRRQRGQDRGVEAAADEDADRNVGHHLLLDRALHQLPRRRQRLSVRQAANGKRLRIPIPNRLLPLLRESNERSGFDATDRAKHRPRLGDVAELQILRDRDVIEIAADVGMPQDALQLGREEDLLTDARIEQRLLAGAIARQQQRARAAIPDREAEHSVELRDRVGAAIEIQRNDRLDIGVRSKRIVGKSRADLRGVVDLAVAFEPDLRAGRRKRLIGALVQVDDAQALGADDGIGMRQHRAAVGSAMAQSLRPSSRELPDSAALSRCPR